MANKSQSDLKIAPSRAASHNLSCSFINRLLSTQGYPSLDLHVRLISPTLLNFLPRLLSQHSRYCTAPFLIISDHFFTRSWIFFQFCPIKTIQSRSPNEEPTQFPQTSAVIMIQMDVIVVPFYLLISLVSAFYLHDFGLTHADSLCTP